MLYRGLRKRDVYRPQPGWGLFFIAFAYAAAGLVAQLSFQIATRA